MLVELAGPGVTAEQLASLVADVGGVRDAVVVADAPGRAWLWRYREAHTEALATLGVAVKLDVSVPVSRLAELVVAAQAATPPGATLHVFGHLGEGNLHLNVAGIDAYVDTVTDAVLAAVAGLGGSIAAEHGVGRAKRAWVGLSRGAAEIDAMRAIKAALDPAGVLNPGVLLPPALLDRAGHHPLDEEALEAKEHDQRDDQR